MDKENFIKEIGQHFGDDLPHIVRNIGDQKVSLDMWKKLGEPYTWTCIQTYIHIQPKFTAQLWSDQGYGYLLLVVDAEIVDVGKDYVESSDHCVIGLSEYYGLKQATLFTKVEGGRG